MTNKIKLPLDELRVGFESAIKQAGTALKGEIPMRLGNPETLALFANDEKTLVYVHTSGDEPGGLTTIPVSSIPKNKLLFAQPILVKPTPYGTLRYVGLDDSEDIIYGQGDIAQTDAMPVLVNQIRWGTIQPTGTLSLLITAAWYGSTYVPDIVTDEFDGTVEDTSSNPIISPTTNNRVIFVLVQINPTNQEVTFKQSIEYNASVGFESAFVNSLVPTIDSGNYKLGYVRLVTGMISFGYGDIYNTPEWLTPTNQDVSANTLTLKDGSTLTLSANIDGAITVTKARHLVDTNAAASSGDLKTVNGLAANEVCVITASDTTRTVVIKHGVDNIVSVTGADIPLDDNIKAVLLLGSIDGAEVWAYPLGGGAPFSDATALVKGSTDPTKQVRIEVDGITAGQTRVITMPDTDLTLIGGSVATGTVGTSDERLIRSDGAGGNKVQGSGVSLSDNGTITNNLLADVVGLSILQSPSQTNSPIRILDSSTNVQTALTANGGAIYNEEGNDVDFRIESDTDPNNFVSDGGNDNVGFGTGTPDASAKVDIVSTTKGFGLPSMTEAQRDAIPSPRDGLLVYNADTDTVDVRANSAWGALGGSTVVSGSKVHKFGANQSTSSNTMVDVDATNAAITATLTGGGKCRVVFAFRAIKNTAGSGFFRLTDGTNSSNEVEVIQAASPELMVIHWVFDTSAGSTTYKLQYRSDNANTITLQAGIAVGMTLLEVA